MANEPSWEDIFTAQPQAAEPAPLVEPLAPSATPSQASPDDPFAQLFGNAAPATAQSTAPTTTEAPASRRELRESEGRKRISDSSGSGGSAGGGGRNSGGSNSGGYDKPRKKHRWLWLKITLPIVLVLGAAGGVAAFGWLNY